MDQSERHPIQELPTPKTLEEAGEQIRLLTIRVAQLWDQVWWLSLPPHIRDHWQRKGFKDPIQYYYGEDA